MKRINEKSINIDKDGDELILKLHIFNSNQYDLMNRRIKITDSIIELDVFNNSENLVEINNPELVIFDINSHNSNVIRYNSSKLQNSFPLSLTPKSSYKFAYNSKKMLTLLKEYSGEVIKFQIKGANEKYYESLNASGDEFEKYITERDQRSSWKHKNVYDFDNKI